MTKVELKDIGKTVFLMPTPELSADMEGWRQRRCTDHSESNWVRVPTAGSTVQIRRQCSKCGYITGQARKHQPDDAELPLADRNAYEDYTQRIEAEREEIQQRHARLQYDRETSWHEEHRTYLQSDEWKSKRRLVLKRAGGICEGCGVAEAVEVHHLHYNNHMNEFLFELVAVCRPCHLRLHADVSGDSPEPDFPVYEHPCNGCRFTAEDDGEWACAMTDSKLLVAMAHDGECGPERKLFEPLR